MEHQLTHHSTFPDLYNKSALLIKKHKAQLKKYIDQLLWWNKRLNLVSRGVSRETIREHVHHSLIISHFEAFQEASLLVDAGTGGGLPGLPLAIAHPNKAFILNDIVTKKVMATRHIGRTLGLQNIDVKDGSIKDLSIEKPFLLLSKHAFKIGDLIEMTEHLPWENIILYKGKGFENELQSITTPLTISVFDLYENTSKAFYRDKVILNISR